VVDTNYSQQLSDAFGFLSPEEIEVIHRTLNLCKDAPIVLEIGTGAGTSLLSVLESRPMSYITSVDIIPSAVAPRIKEAGFSSDRISLVVDYSLNVVKTWEKEIDVFILDGNHNPDNVLKDMKAWCPHLAVGGYFIVHDYGDGNRMWIEKKEVVDKYARYHGLKLIDHAKALAVFEKFSTKRKRQSSKKVTA